MRVTDWVNTIAGSLGHSWEAGNALSQGFSKRVSYIKGRTIHGGYDIPGTIGTPITALRSGRVVYSKLNGTRGTADAPGTGWGELVIIEGTDSRLYWYAHLNIRSVLVGQDATAGQKIGTLGTTGYSTGPHLHFEIRSATGQLIDPATIPDDTSMPYQPNQFQQQCFSDLAGIGVFTVDTPKTQDRYELAVILKRVFLAGDKRWRRLDGSNEHP